MSMSRRGNLCCKTTITIVSSLSGYSTRVVGETYRQFAELIPGFQGKLSLLEMILYLLTVSQHQ
jgi:hypothetical protein